MVYCIYYNSYRADDVAKTSFNKAEIGGAEGGGDNYARSSFLCRRASSYEIHVKETHICVFDVIASNPPAIHQCLADSRQTLKFPTWTDFCTGGLLPHARNLRSLTTMLRRLSNGATYRGPLTSQWHWKTTPVSSMAFFRATKLFLDWLMLRVYLGLQYRFVCFCPRQQSIYSLNRKTSTVTLK